MLKQNERAEAASAGTHDFFKSMFSFSWAQSLFGLRQIAGVVSPGRNAVSLDHVTHAAEAELNDAVRNFFRLGDRVQRETVDMLCGAFFRTRQASQSAGASGPTAQPPQPPSQSKTGTPSMSASGGPTSPYAPADGPAYKVSAGRLNKSSFVVLGEGLAAGMGDFTLCEETQRESFPAQMARQMQTEMLQAEFQAPGICYPAGFTRPPVLVPQPLQSTVFKTIPPVQV